jgi:hypothetical protein
MERQDSEIFDCWRDPETGCFDAGLAETFQPAVGKYRQ